ncbi:SGNH/GDSL hydrolase family protein [Streptomyces sp. NPDC003333]
MRWRNYVAVGDSFTEGMDDAYPDGTYRGWADLVATRLAAEAGPDFGYANLAIRGHAVECPVAFALGTAGSVVQRPRLRPVRQCGLVRAAAFARRGGKPDKPQGVRETPTPPGSARLPVALMSAPGRLGVGPNVRFRAGLDR